MMVLGKLGARLVVFGVVLYPAVAFEAKHILGIVKDSRTNNPIQGAEISVGGKVANDKPVSDDTGFFKLSLADSVDSVVRLRVEKAGYNPADLQVSVNDELIHQISLKALGMGTAAANRRAADSGDTYVPPESFSSALRADAKTAFDSMRKRYEFGVENFFSVVIAHDKLIQVELLLTQKRQERIAVYKAALEIARKLEVESQSRYTLGVDSQNSVFLGRLHRSEVELLLAKEQSRTSP
jgi:hypothetical protein